MPVSLLKVHAKLNRLGLRLGGSGSVMVEIQVASADHREKAVLSSAMF